MKKACFIKILAALSTAVLLGYCSDTFAAPQTLGAIATGVTESFKGLAKLITAGAFLAGIGFAMAAIFKFKAHKDNPQQIPIGTPVALLFVAAALMFLPAVYGSMGTTIFGSSGKGDLTGTTSFE